MRRQRMKQVITRAVRYSPALGARYGLKTAQAVGCEVEAMMAQGLVVTPHALLERARDEGSVLHPLFTWDTEVAAEKYRLHEARQILNHLEVVVREGEREVTQRAFFSLSIADSDPEEDTRRRYVSVSEVWQSEQMQAQIRQAALKELRSWCQKYAMFTWQEVERVSAVVSLCDENEDSV